MYQLFDDKLTEWAKLASSSWGFPEPSHEFYERFFNRIPENVRSILGSGIQNGIIVSRGCQFQLKGQEQRNGLYSWFSKFTTAKEPAPNWEYYVHVAYYAQLFNIVKHTELVLNFEDHLMDLTIYHDGKLKICIEVKEKAEQLLKLLDGIKQHQNNVDISSLDRGTDPLRKAKYIVQNRPEYFCLWAINTKLNYKVNYFGNDSFELISSHLPDDFNSIEN